MNTKLKHGFTLIELLVVISIIALLMSIVLTSLGVSKQRGDDGAKIAALREVRTAINQYFNDNGYYPTGAFGTAVADLTAALVPKYISLINTNIKYKSVNTDLSTCLSNCASYHLAVVLMRTDNKVLSIDSDIVTGGFDGTKDNCTTTTPPPGAPDLCYDVAP